MAKKSFKVGLVIALCGAVLPTSCVWPGGWSGFIWSGLLDVGWDFVLDNDAVFDVFQDDFGTGQFYNDRLTANPSRQEP